MMGRSVKMRLPRVIEGSARLSGGNALSRQQARRMLAFVAPWRSRPSMSESQGQALLSNLSGVLSSSQKSALVADRPRMDGPRPGGRGPGRGDGGGHRPPPGGGNWDAMRSMMATFNPLYIGSSPVLAALPERMREGMQRRRDHLNAAVSQLKQKAR